jgi:arsenate reductase-like glutaredoxin family protein
MSENIAENTIAYSDLIKEVYIDPIRTVIVIDDEFPSLDGLIAKELEEEKPMTWEKPNVQKVREILNFCRNKDKPWLVDVHDGKKVGVNQDEKIAPYLHHSDLVILDYHLNGDDGNGDQAIEILRKLAENDHFNMVIIYTKGYGEPGGDIDRVVREIALGLSSIDNSFELPEEKIRSIKDIIEEWETYDEDIFEKLKSEMTKQTYLAIRSKKDDCQKALGLPECKGFMELFTGRPKNINIPPKVLLQLLAAEKETEIKDQLSPIPLGDVTLSAPGSKVNWIRTNRLFVSVVSKSNQPEEIPEKLLQALDEWCPRPHRLVLSKMRSLIDEHGVVAEAEVLSNDFIQTGWLLDLLNTFDSNKLGAIRNTTNRHWEALGDAMEDNITEFGDRLIKYISKQDRKDIIKTHCPLNPRGDEKNISKHLNCYISTKPVERSNLTTGHILELSIADDRKEYGICLSPACDMVPNQKTSGWYGRLGDFIPFIMVSIDETPAKTALKKIDHNIFLFLKISGDIKTFTFNPSGDVRKNPNWEQMFAGNKGIPIGTSGEMTIGRLVSVSDPPNLKIETIQAKIVAQLRYEYALNLLQRLGISLTRIGLDFKNIQQAQPKPEKVDG